MKRKYLKPVALGATALLMSVAFTGCSFFDGLFGKEEPEPERQRYTVTFNTNGGTTVSTEGIYIDDVPVRPADPAKEGHTFGGWFLDSEYTQEYLFDTPLNKDVTLYAKLSPKSFEDYTLIYTAADLASVSEDVAGKYLLAEDVNLKGDIWTPIENFTGTLDGNGHKIFNFVMSENNETSGFIRKNSGTIENVTFDDYDVSTSRNANGDSFFGLIVGQNEGTISNCAVTNNGSFKVANHYSSNTTMSSYIGSICGSNSEGGSIKNVRSSAIVECAASVGSWKWADATQNIIAGGIVGSNVGTVEKSAYHGTMTANVKINSTEGGRYSNSYIGGIVGQQKATGEIHTCSSDATLNLVNETGVDLSRIGMICASNEGGLVEDCMANGKITRSGNATNSHIGGIVGLDGSAGKISNCYSATEITCTSDGGGTTIIGGIVGRVEANGVVKACCMAGSISSEKATAYGYVIGSPDNTGYSCFKCFYSSSCRITVGEEIKTEGTCTDGTAKTLAELQSKDLLIDTLYWETSIWNVGSGHPTLK